METWKVTIKENGHEYLLTPEYHLSNMFDHIKNESLREKYLRKFFGGIE